RDDPRGGVSVAGRASLMGKEWANGRMGEWANGRMGEWANRRIGESANRRIGESANRRIGESANRRIGESGNRRMGEWGNQDLACIGCVQLPILAPNGRLRVNGWKKRILTTNFTN